MKSWLIRSSWGLDHLALEEVQPPQFLESNHVKIKVAYCGLNHPDLLVIKNQYQHQPSLPFSPGGEIVGKIIKTGLDVKDLTINQAVVALNSWGGLSEYVNVPEAHVIQLPETISLDFAAGHYYNFATAAYALRLKAGFRSEHTVAVFGAGSGLGLAAVTLAKSIGAKVVALASTEEKLHLAAQQKADWVFPSNNFDVTLKENNIKIDVVFDPVGAKANGLILKRMNKGSKYLLMGFASGDRPDIPLNLALLKEIQIIGVHFTSFFKENRMMFNRLLEELHQIFHRPDFKPVPFTIHRFEDAQSVLERLNKGSLKGKQIVQVS